MDKISTKARYIILIFFALCLILCTIYYNSIDYSSLDSMLSFLNDDEDIIHFSAPSGLYEETISLDLYAHSKIPKEAVIYYTTNGDDPNENSSIFSESIILKNIDNNITFYPIKARLYYKGEFSDNIFENLYVIGTDVHNTYDLNVISITSDSYNLYDYYDGILTDGYIYDQNIDAGKTGFIWGNPGERGDEWIRNAHIVMFTPDGEIIWNQDIGIGISGGTSSMMSIKSFKIIASEIYDPITPKFSFDGYYVDKEMTPLSMVETYNTFKLRGGSQDVDQGNIRSALLSRLAEQSGFAGYADTERALVYLNGKAYGIFDIKPRYVGSYLSDRFDLDDSQAVVKYELLENQCFESAGIKDLFMTDLNVTENREKLESVVDMDDFLLYYAFQSLVNNTDWPQNNFEMWHYTGSPDPYNEYTDGRFRFLFYDTDTTFYTAKNPQYFPGISANVLESMLKSQYRSNDSVFKNVMESHYYRDKFVTIICDLLNTSFKSENVINLIDAEFEKIKNSNNLKYGSWRNEHALYYINLMKTEVKSRDSEIRSILRKYFNLYKQYSFSLSTSEGISVSWGNTNLLGNQTYENKYYFDTEIEITQQAYPGYEFKYWLVNGEIVDSDILKISNKYIHNNTVEIQAVAEKHSLGSLIISEIYAKGNADWIKLTVVGGNSVALDRYYLTDDNNNQKFQLPALILSPGESTIIHGKHDYSAVGDYICNFSLNNSETLKLYDSAEHKIVDIMRIPKMEATETYGRYENSPHYVFFKNKNGQRKFSTY